MTLRSAITTGLALLLAIPAAAAPRVTSVSPPNGAKDVRTSVNIRLDFDTVMDASTINTGTVLLDGKPLSEVPDAAVVHPNGTSSVILLRLGPNNSYRFTLTTAVRDAAGSALAEPFTWEFVTASRVDDPDTPVRIFARYPRMNDFEIPTNAPITMTFTTEMDAASFTDGGILVRKTTGGAPVEGKVEVRGRRVIFRPTAPLPPRQTFEAVVSADVTSRVGAKATKEAAWQFTTAGGPYEGLVVADAWYETYDEPTGTRFVFHAAVEQLKSPKATGRQTEAAAEAPPQSPAFQVKGTVVSLSGILPQQPLSTPTGQSAKDMPITTGPTTVVTAAYTHGGGAGPGNSVEGSTWVDPMQEKIEAAVDAAFEGNGAVGLHDSGDVAEHSDREKGDGVLSGRLVLPRGFPEGQALVAFVLIPSDGKRADPLTMGVYIMPPPPEAAAPASHETASPASR